MTRKEQPRQSVAYSPRSKLGTLLPAFPEMKDIRLPEHLSEIKVSSIFINNLKPVVSFAAAPNVIEAEI